MNEDYLLKKIEDSHQAIAKTVSDFGDKVNKSNITIASIDTKLGDFIDRIDKKIATHDNDIDTLKEAKTTIFTSISTTKFVAGSLFAIITVMGGYIITTWTNTFDTRLNKIESERKETLDKVLQLLGDKKNFINIDTEILKDIFANL